MVDWKEKAIAASDEQRVRLRTQQTEATIKALYGVLCDMSLVRELSPKEREAFVTEYGLRPLLAEGVVLLPEQSPLRKSPLKVRAIDGYSSLAKRLVVEITCPTCGKTRWSHPIHDLAMLGRLYQLDFDRRCPDCRPDERERRDWAEEFLGRFEQLLEDLDGRC